MATTFAGRILLADEVVEGFLTVEGGRIVDAGHGENPEPPTARGWIVPSLINAHTHVGDAFLRGRDKPHSVKELVGPGGWKHKHLAAASPGEQIAGIQSHVSEMAGAGVGTFLDFREGGLAGIRRVREIPQLPVEAVLFGRPAKPGFSEVEAYDILEEADGVGLPGLGDMKAADVESWAEAAHQHGKPVALHLSEDRHEDAAAAIALQPRFVVHALACTPEEWEELSQADVAVVVAPRSNAYFGLKTPVLAMLDAGLSIAVGTDNGMLNDGNPLADLGQLHASYPRLPTEDLLRMATYAGRTILGRPTPMFPRAGQRADWIVLPDDPFPSAPRRKPGFEPGAPT